jgi:hypothetical protein
MAKGWDVARQQQSGQVVEFSVEDADDFDVLFNELRGTPGLAIEAVPAPMAEGDQGSALDFLTVACSGGAITAALQLVRAVIESRGPRFSLKVRRGKERIEINAANIEEMLPLLKELLGGA